MKNILFILFVLIFASCDDTELDCVCCNNFEFSSRLVNIYSDTMFIEVSWNVMEMCDFERISINGNFADFQTYNSINSTDRVGSEIMKVRHGFIGRYEGGIRTCNTMKSVEWVSYFGQWSIFHPFSDYYTEAENIHLTDYCP